MKAILKIFGCSILCLVMGTGCVTRTYHSSGAFSSNFATSRGSNWPDEQQILLRYQIREGQAALQSERVVLVFHGLPPEQQRMFHFQEAQQAVPIAGDGTFSMSTTCSSGKQTITFRSDYSAGTNTLEFGGRRVSLTSNGRSVSVGDQTVDLSEGLKIIHLKGDKVWVE